MVRGCSPSWIPWRSCCLTARACLFWARMHLPHGPSEAVLQVSCCRRPGDAPNALASGKSAQEHWRWTSRPHQSCLTRFPWMQCIDAGPRAHPLTELQRGHDAHVMVWLQPAASIGCSMGAGSMWSEGVLWAVSHGESVALRNSTLTFAARTACAQLGSEGACGGRSSGAGASSPNAWGVAPGACASWQGCLDSYCSILQHSAAVVSMDAASTPAYILAVHTAHAHAAHAANGQHAAAGFCPCASKVFQRSNHRAVGPLGCMCASCFDPSNVCNEQVSPDS